MNISKLSLVMFALAAVVVTGCSRQASSSDSAASHAEAVVATGGPISIEHCSG